MAVHPSTTAPTPARDDRARRLRGRAADEDRPRVRRCAALDEVVDGYDVVLLDCPPSLGVLTHQRADGRRRGADPAAVRVAVPPRCRPAARHRRTSAAADQPRPAGARRAADDVRRAHQPRPRSARRHLRPLRALGPRAADREVGAVRRGAGGRQVDPAHRGPSPGAEAYRSLARRLVGIEEPAAPLDGGRAADRPVRPRWCRHDESPDASGGFDRIRPRSPESETALSAPRDAQGKRALFSATEGRAMPGVGSISVEYASAVASARCCRRSPRCVPRSVAAAVGRRRARRPRVDSGAVPSSLRRLPALPRLPSSSWARLSVRV